jgi:hypothetical protein
MRRAADPCQNSTPAQLQAGESALRQIEREYQSQVKVLADAGLPALYANRIKDLNSQIDQAKMAPRYAEPPRAWVRGFEKYLLTAPSAELAEIHYEGVVQQLAPYLKQWREN